MINDIIYRERGETVNFFGHLITVTRHRNRVMKHCFKVGLYSQGLRHDLSKFSPSEFLAGVKYYQGTRSPNARERELFGFSRAWMHHKGRNKHHFEYWSDVGKSGLYEPVEMPINYVAEMFCDRVAASEIYKGKDYTQDYPLQYYRSGRACDSMHKNTAALLEKWLVLLAEEGEKAAFDEVKEAVKNYKKNKR